jgi:hypothetical protein
LPLVVIDVGSDTRNIAPALEAAGGSVLTVVAPAAVTAVEQWRYEPATVRSEPVDAETKVYVTFELTR